MVPFPSPMSAYLADDAAVAAAKPYLADDAAVAAAKPYVADSADVMAAKAEFKKYFDAREMGIPATPGALEPVQVGWYSSGYQFNWLKNRLKNHLRILILEKLLKWVV